MQNYSLSHLANPVLIQNTRALAAQDRATLASLLAHLAEVDARHLYLPAGYPSMVAWCIGELKMSEDEAFKRIRVARAARSFPALLPMIADGRLTLTTLLVLAPHLTPANADGLFAAATGRTRVDVELLLAERFPRPDLAEQVRPLAPAVPMAPRLAPGRVEALRGRGLQAHPRGARRAQLPGPVPEDR